MKSLKDIILHGKLYNERMKLEAELPSAPRQSMPEMHDLKLRIIWHMQHFEPEAAKA